MKIQYTAVIFILIAIPILLVVSYYMGLQIDTITLQTTYNTKLLASTKAAIEAFEINTVEWNNQYSDVANSRRRNVEASINTFTQSLANNLGISGANKEYLEAYLPAVLYTLYDGYYIYTPTSTKETVKNEEGQDALTENGEIIYKAETGGIDIKDADGNTYNNATRNSAYAVTTTEHTLLPFVSYSEQIDNITINYTLDNYIKVYGEFKCEQNYANYGGDKSKPLVKTGEKRQGSSSYVQEEGHLVYNKYDMTNRKIDEIKYKPDDSIEVDIKPETLTENVTYKSGGTYKTDNFKYIYIEDSQGDKTKLYYSATPGATRNNWFTLNSKDEQIFLSDNVTNVTQYVYKKVSLPGLGENDPNGVNTSGRYINFYQVLNGDIKGQWYADWNQDGELPPSEQVPKETYGLNNIDDTEDCSAIKYYVQAYYFTRWVNNCVAKNLDAIDDMGFKYKDNIFTIGVNNDPGNPEKEKKSAFYQHKNQIIQNQIMNSLAQAIKTYEESSGKLPNLTGEEWEQILSNVSVVSFLQGIPIGLKTYNSYAIATSTNNREVVDPNEIYFINDSDKYYHRCYCNQTQSTTNLIGYRSVDFVERNYTTKDADEKETTKYYFLHNANTITGDKLNASMACYYCLVNRANYTKTTDDAMTTAYNTALARERYKAKQDVVLAKEYAEFTVNKNMIGIDERSGTIGDNIAEVGDIITWEIIVTNKGKAGGQAYFYDKMPDGLKITNVGEIGSAFIEDGKNITEDGIYGYIYVNATSNKTITIKTEVTSNVTLGTLTNIVILKNKATSDFSIAQASAKVTAEKTVEITRSGTGQPYNVVLILDDSSSMLGQYANVKIKAERFLKKLWPDGFAEGEVANLSDIGSSKDDSLHVISFNDLAWRNIVQYNTSDKSFNIQGYIPTVLASTNYYAALNKAIQECLSTSGEKKNVVVFLTDGGPTLLQTDFGIPLLTPITSGWCVAYITGGTAGNYSYAYAPLITLGVAIKDIVANNLEKGSYAKYLWEGEDGVRKGLLDLADEIKAEDGYNADIYSVYFKTSFTAGDNPRFGLQLISSDNGANLTDSFYYSADNTAALEEAFEKIANNILPPANIDSVKTTRGVVALDEKGLIVSKIKCIVINGAETVSLEEAKIKGYITTDGKLDVQKIGPEKSIKIEFNP